MADRSLRRRAVACLATVVLALGAAAFLVWSLRQHDEARRDLHDARAELRRDRAASSAEARDLRSATHAVGALRGQVQTITANGARIADLDDQDLAAVRAAVQAGLSGGLDGYNAAVQQRDVLDSEHDAALEQLRQQVNAVITALAPVTG
jgi:hypothetical protein